MNKRMLWIGLSLLVALSLALSGCQNQPTAEEIVAKMKEVEASTEDAHAVLEFSAQGEGLEMDLVFEMWEKRPNQLRIEVLEAGGGDEDLVGAVSVTDGSQAWAYDPRSNEVLISDTVPDDLSDPHQMIQSMEEIIQQALDASDVELVGEEDVAGVATYKLSLTPKEGEEAFLPMGGEVTLWVDQERWVVLQAHFIGDLVGEAHMRVRSFELNTGIADERFQFEIPEGAEVVDVGDLEEMEPTHLTLEEAQAQADFDLLTPSYVPGEATLIDVFTVNGGFVFRYDHAATSFTIMQGSSEASGSVPAGQTAEVSVRGQVVTLVTDDQGNSFLSWEEAGVTRVIAGRIGEEEVLKVTESLQ
jgi:outer membrane lipoprotein-sorting protein